MTDSNKNRLYHPTLNLEPDPREKNLPVWAQGLIRELRRGCVDSLRWAEECRLDTAPEQSTMLVERFGAPPIGLGTDAHLVYLAEPGDDPLMDGLSVHPVGGHLLRIAAYHGGLWVGPSASNSVTVRWGG